MYKMIHKTDPHDLSGLHLRYLDIPFPGWLTSPLWDRHGRNLQPWLWLLIPVMICVHKKHQHANKANEVKERVFLNVYLKPFGMCQNHFFTCSFSFLTDYFCLKQQNTFPHITCLAVKAPSPWQKHHSCTIVCYRHVTANSVCQGFFLFLVCSGLKITNIT